MQVIYIKSNLWLIYLENGWITYLVPRISYLSQAILVYSHLLFWFLSVEVRMIGEKLRWVTYYCNQRFKTKNSMKCHGNPKPFSKRKCVTSSVAKDISTWIQYVLSLCCKLIVNQSTWSIMFKKYTLDHMMRFISLNSLPLRIWVSSYSLHAERKE